MTTRPYKAHRLIDYDVRVVGEAFGMFSEWQQGNSVRCDIHVLHDASGRRLEVVNVNATPVESRLGTDMLSSTDLVASCGVPA